jgi:pyrroloquinoline-quinone synthase
VSGKLIDRIDATLRGRGLLDHPFFVALEQGSLPLDSLQGYGAQFYHFELAYPTILAGLHRRCTLQRFKQELLDRLWAESRDEVKHVDLWLDLCEALGLAREEVQARGPSTATAGLVDTLRELSDRESVIGASALYAYESQAPLLSMVIPEALATHYGIDKDTCSFFEVHRPLDEEQAAGVRELVMAQSGGEADNQALEAADRVATALWRFLDDLV